MAKNINKNEFDESTLDKLSLFQQYLHEWLPVFIQFGYNQKLAVWDFFAGSGYDPNGKAGSPIRILNEIMLYGEQIKEKKASIQVHLNEGKPTKAADLKDAVTSLCDSSSWGLQDFVSVNCYGSDFKNLFSEKLQLLNQHPNLIFIDQYGLKEVDKEIFCKLASIPKTDFMFFLSSSFAKRFCSVKEMRSLYPESLMETLERSDFKDVHRIMRQYYQNLIPPESEMKLYPFSLKKDSNIYGVIFGSAHLLGVKKFLDLAWKANDINGEANFDIDDDAAKSQGVLFPDCRRLTKLQQFDKELRGKIIAMKSISNVEIYHFTLEHGHIAKHARASIAGMKKDGIVTYEGSPLISYENCIKNPKLHQIKVAGYGH